MSLYDETTPQAEVTRDPLGRLIVHVSKNAHEELIADIRRMISRSRSAAATLGVSLRCHLTQQRKLVCEIKPDCIKGFGDLVDSPHFFQNDCGVSFVPHGLAIDEEPIKLYGVIFLPGQFKQMCEQILREEGYQP